MDINSLNILVLVARLGSFAAAARVLDVDPSSVSRQVAQAEAALGLRLFQRSTRRLNVTEAGETYLRRIAPLLEEFDAARDAAAEQRGQVRGQLRLTASAAYTHVCLMPLMPELRDTHPDLAIELLATDEPLDLLAQNIDLALRMGDAPVGDLVGARIAKTSYCVCASPLYLSRAGALAQPSDLSGRDCLRFALPQYRSRWLFRDAVGAVEEVPVGGSLVISNALALRDAARAGLGPALLSDWLVRDDLAAGRLVDLFPDYQATATGFDTAVWALYPSRRYLPAKVRAAIDFLRPRLATVRS